jgi:hypothetical protein
VTQPQPGASTRPLYLATRTAAINGPVTIGQTVDWLGYRAMFIFAAVCLLLAAFFLSRVTKGEAHYEAQPARPLDLSGDTVPEVPELG